MAIVQNSRTIQELREAAALQVGKDAIPTTLATQIVPVMEVNPKLLRHCDVVKRNQAVNATSATIYTTPATQDFYLVSACVTLIKDATATSTFSRINAVVLGATASFCEIASLTLTAQSETVSMTFPRPIKIDRNTAITVTNTTNVGNVTAAACIVGFIVDNSNA